MCVFVFVPYDAEQAQAANWHISEDIEIDMEKQTSRYSMYSVHR